MEVPISYFAKKILSNPKLREDFYQEILGNSNKGKNYYSKKDLENKLN
jgi:hypothetical protein